MARSNLGRRLADKITERQREVAEQLVSGSADNYDEYKYTVGLVEGLREAFLMLDELERED